MTYTESVAFSFSYVLEHYNGHPVYPKHCNANMKIMKSFLFTCVLQTYARSNATDAGHTQYAAKITGPILEFYEKYFDMNYAQKKLGKMTKQKHNSFKMEI